MHIKGHYAWIINQRISFNDDSRWGALHLSFMHFCCLHTLWVLQYKHECQCWRCVIFSFTVWTDVKLHCSDFEAVLPLPDWVFECSSLYLLVHLMILILSPCRKLEIHTTNLWWHFWKVAVLYTSSIIIGHILIYKVFKSIYWPLISLTTCNFVHCHKINSILKHFEIWIYWYHIYSLNIHIIFGQSLHTLTFSNQNMPCKS